LRDAERFFSHLFPGVAGLHPSSFNRRVKKLRRFPEPLRRDAAAELVGKPETLIVDSTLLPVVRPLQVGRSAGWGSPSSGAAWVRWGSFTVYRVKLHLSCATNGGHPSCELTAANVAEVKLAEEFLAEAGLPGEAAARRPLGDLAYRSEALTEAPADRGVVLVTERSRQGGAGQQVEIALASLRRVFGIGGTLATTLVTRPTSVVAAKIAAYTYAFSRSTGSWGGRKGG
jgi:hypothetical protein